MSNKIYDVLKYVALIFLPALGTLYFALASIWGLPYGEQIVGTITAIDTFLGALLGISSKKFNASLSPDDLVYDKSMPTDNHSSEDGTVEPVGDLDDDGGE